MRSPVIVFFAILVTPDGKVAFGGHPEDTGLQARRLYPGDKRRELLIRTMPDAVEQFCLRQRLLWHPGGPSRLLDWLEFRDIAEFALTKLLDQLALGLNFARRDLEVVRR